MTRWLIFFLIHIAGDITDHFMLWHICGCSFSGGGACFRLSDLGSTKVSLFETILIQALLDKPVVKLIGTGLYFTFSRTYSLSMVVEQVLK